MPTIYVDNSPYEVKDGQNLLEACLSLGFDLPYFCWHPAMHSVGACRQCAVKQFRDEADTRGRIVMACMTPAADGTRISIDDADANAFRASVIEWLMENHPHDCPVCDEGSECHLQDMTEMTGHNYRRFRFKKRTYRNQYLGPFVNHEMNRCIQCYRCVRYYRDYAGGQDLNVFASHNSVYFGRQDDGVLENEFSGNLAEICPTGVFTDKSFKRHYTRKWDLQTAPSICVNCSVGCNTIPGERYGELRRIRNRYNGQVNGYFLCDRGRYGYEFVNSDRRIREPEIRTEDSGLRAEPETPLSPQSPVLSPGRTGLSPEEAVRRAAEILAGSRRVIGIGSPRASLEANFALRTLVGPENFHLGISDQEAGILSTLLEILHRGPAPTPSLQEVEASDAVLVLGEDVTNSAPILALALRQASRQRPIREAAARIKAPLWHDAAIREAIQDRKGPFFLATVSATKLDEVATHSFYAAPDEIARLGFAVAQAIGTQGQPPLQISEQMRTLAAAAADALKDAENPLIVAGTGLGSEAILHAAAAVATALQIAGKPAKLSFVVPECNSLGLGLMGGRTLGEAFEAVREGRADTVIVLENDLYRRADGAEVDSFLERVRYLVALDHLANATSTKAEVALPAATFAESDGTFVNNEGRAQRFYQVFVPSGAVQESWRWLRDIQIAAGRPESALWKGLDDVTASMVEALPIFRPVAEIAPPASFRIAGEKVARQHQRYSGRTAMFANVTVHEPKPPEDPDAPFAFSMEGYQGEPPSPLIPRFWAPGWNSIQALNKFQEEVGGPLRGGDPGKRLIEPGPGTPIPAAEIPPNFSPRPGEWLVVPLYHIFGSEELSLLSPGVAELAPLPYLGLNPREIAERGLREGEEIDISLGGRPRRLPIKLIPTLPIGLAGVPSGLPELAGVVLPVWTHWMP